MEYKEDLSCQICHQFFSLKEIYPLALVRHSVMESARKKYPHLLEQGFVCYPDLRQLNAIHFEKVIGEVRGEVTGLEKEVLQSIKTQELLSENPNVEFEEKISFGGKVADRVAAYGGSWSFIISFAVLLVIWMGMNSWLYAQNPFDPYPFILLNLVLSSLAAFQAPIIMMSQNRQSSKDRIKIENDYLVNLKAELQIRQLNARLEVFMKYQWQKINELNKTLEEVLQELDHVKK